MNDLATLLTAVATLVTAVGGSIGVVVTAIRSGHRQARAAAEKAVDEADADRDRELAELREQVRRLTEGGAS